MTPYRLKNDDPHSWAMYPLFEARCIAFIDRHQIDFDKLAFSRQLRERFMDPVFERHRLYAFLDDTGHMRGHFLAWVDVAYNRPYIHVHHLDVDDGYSVRETMDRMFVEMDAWFAALNSGIPEGHVARFDKASFWTWHPPEVFARYLRPGCSLKVERYVLEYSQAERLAAREKTDTETVH